jgi:hypothetical protein
MLTTLATLAIYFASVFVVMGVIGASEQAAGGSCLSGELNGLDDSLGDSLLEATHETTTVDDQPSAEKVTEKHTMW